MIFNINYCCAMFVCLFFFLLFSFSSCFCFAEILFFHLYPFGRFKSLSLYFVNVGFASSSSSSSSSFVSCLTSTQINHIVFFVCFTLLLILAISLTPFTRAGYWGLKESLCVFGSREQWVKRQRGLWLDWCFESGVQNE